MEPLYYTLTPMALHSLRISHLDRHARNVLFCLVDFPRSVAELALMLHLGTEQAFLDINWLILHGLVCIQPTLAEAARTAQCRRAAPRPSPLRRLFNIVGGRHDRRSSNSRYVDRAA